VQVNIQLKRSKNEAMLLRTRAEQGAQLLRTLSQSFKAKEASLSAATSSMADMDVGLLRSEIQQVALNGKQAAERHKADKLAYGQLVQRLAELREHEEDLFAELVGQVQRRTVNDCYECQNSSKICVFSDDSEQCTQCQSPPRRRCQGSVEDEDTDRFKAAVETVNSQIDDILSHNLPNTHLYRSLKARLEQESNAATAYTVHLGSTPQDQTEYADRVTRMNSTVKEVQEFREQSLINDTAYQELLVRRRMLEECLFELLRRGVFYYDELEELAGHPERRGRKRAEEMDHDKYREAVEWAAEHPGEWPDSPVPVGIQENGSDSGIEM
jgi:hypothetical protein